MESPNRWSLDQPEEKQAASAQLMLTKSVCYFFNNLISLSLRLSVCLVKLNQISQRNVKHNLVSAKKSGNSKLLMQLCGSSGGIHAEPMQ